MLTVDELMALLAPILEVNQNSLDHARLRKQQSVVYPMVCHYSSTQFLNRAKTHNTQRLSSILL